MGKYKRALALALLLLIMMTGLAGCARLRSGVHDLHGSIIGNEYNIDIFDNTGVRTMRSHGKKIDIDNNIVEERTYSSVSEEWYTTKTLSSVITITIDGKQLISCGDTCIFYDKRLVPEYEFYLDNVESSSSGLTDTALIRGGSAPLYKADDRRARAVHPPGKLPDHRQVPARLRPLIRFLDKFLEKQYN